MAPGLVQDRNPGQVVESASFFLINEVDASAELMESYSYSRSTTQMLDSSTSISLSQRTAEHISAIPTHEQSTTT